MKQEKLPMKMVQIMNRKGGVGKSSITLWLASGLANRGYHVGIVDLDVDGGATSSESARDSSVKPLPFQVFTEFPDSDAEDMPDDFDLLLLDTPGSNHERYPVDLTIIPFIPQKASASTFMKVMNTDVFGKIDNYIGVMNRFEKRKKEKHFKRMSDLRADGYPVDYYFSLIECYENLSEEGCFPFQLGGEMKESSNRMHDVRREVNLFTDLVLKRLSLPMFNNTDKEEQANGH